MHDKINKTFQGDYALVLTKIFLLTIITCAVYSNILDNDFVFDDSRIYLNPHLRPTTLDLPNIIEVWNNSEPKTRPLANLSFALNYYFHQHEVRGYHIVNIAVHLATGIFLFLLIRTSLNLPVMRPRYGSFYWLPFAGALLWLVHPIQTQSVSYTIQRMNSLASMFYIICIYSYVKGRLSAGLSGKVLWGIGTAGAGAMSFWSKEIALTLPLFMILYDCYFLRDSGGGWFKKVNFSTLFPIVLLGVVALVFYFGNAPLNDIFAGYADRDFTLAERLLTESRVLIFYLSLLFLPLPNRLNLDHHFLISTSLLEPFNTFLSIACLALLLLSAIYFFRRHRLLSFGIIWFFGNLFIESTFIPLELVFEHRLYLPSTLLIVAVTAFVREALPDNYSGLFLGTALVILLSFWTYQRNTVWSGPITLWNDSVGKSPSKARVHSNFGVALKRAGNLNKAEAHFRETIRLDPRFFEAYNNLGNIMFIKGRLEEAAAFYRQALSVKPNHAVLHVNLGNVLMDLWRLPEAREHYRQALKIQPRNRTARANLSRVERMIKSRKNNHN